MRLRRGKSRSDASTPETAVPVDSAPVTGYSDDDALISSFGSESEGVWDSSADTPLTGGANAALSAVPEDLLHADRAKSVRFQIASPSGYYFPQVEEFVRQVVAALKQWEELVHERDLYIHSLNRELDLQRHDVRSLRMQIEIFRVQGDPMVGKDGSYVTESQVSNNPTGGVQTNSTSEQEVIALREYVASLEMQNDALQAAAESESNNLLAWQNAVAERDELITSLQDEVSRLTQGDPDDYSPAPASPDAPQWGVNAPTTPQPYTPAATPSPAPQSPQPPIPAASAPAWTPQQSAAPAQPYGADNYGYGSPSAPDPRLASPGQISFEQPDRLSVWAPDLINNPLVLTDDDMPNAADGIPDTAFRDH